DAITLSTGWNVRVYLGRNLMLNEDQASFVNPKYEPWNSGSRYTVGDRVEYLGKVWSNLVSAYGMAQAPPSTGTANTWWSQVQRTALVSGHEFDNSGQRYWDS